MMRGAPDYDQAPEILAAQPEDRGIAGEDEERALEALRRAWGDAYAVCLDEAASPPWRAWRLGKVGVMLSAATPDGLDAAIRADWQAAQ
jgi:hypothetical protein